MTPGDTARVGMPHPEIFAAITPGSDLLLDDGKVRLRVLKVHGDAADTEVVAGTKLSDRKGVNVPGVILPLSALTDKDRRDLDAALQELLAQPAQPPVPPSGIAQTVDWLARLLNAQ